MDKVLKTEWSIFQHFLRFEAVGNDQDHPMVQAWIELYYLYVERENEYQPSRQ